MNRKFQTTLLQCPRCEEDDHIMVAIKELETDFRGVILYTCAACAARWMTPTDQVETPKVTCYEQVDLT